MSFIRKSLVAIFASLLTLALIGLALSLGLSHTFGNSNNVKQVLADSGVYKTIVPDALTQTKSISTSVGDIPLSDPQIRSAAEASLPSSEVQSYGNQIVDGIYNWLNGQVATPNFAINLQAPKERLAGNVSSVVKQRAASLPMCTSLAQISTNIYDASCLPPGVNASQIAEQVHSQIASSQDYLGQADITAASVKSSGSNKSIFNDQLKSLPKKYQKLKKAPLLLVVLVLLLSAAVLALSSTRGRGLRRVGIALATAGLVTLIFAWTIREVVNRAVVPHINIASSVTQTEVRKVVTDLVTPTDKTLLIMGIVYLALALAFIFSQNIFTWVSSRLNHHHETETAPAREG